MAGGILFSVAFTALIWYAGQHWMPVREFTPDRPGFWYEWQLLEPTWLTRASAWTGYVLHQVTLWALIWHAQQSGLRYTSGLHRVNVLALGANAFFITLHLLQTRYFYDGLAQDVHEATSQWSVIILLCAVLVMENQRRGIAFGHKSSLLSEAGQTVRRYHGYYFSWAIVYTFWYHPMEATSGHLAGFLYMFLLLLQGSLFFTRIHVNRYWTFFQEFTVVVHGTMVAWMQGHAWQMFLSGFLGVFVITQMHGLGLPRAWRWAIALGYIALLAILYSDLGWARLPAVFGIPLIEILGAYVLAFLVVRWLRWHRGRRAAAGSLPAET